MCDSIQVSFDVRVTGDVNEALVSRSNVVAADRQPRSETTVVVSVGDDRNGTSRRTNEDSVEEEQPWCPRGLAVPAQFTKVRTSAWPRF